MGRKIKLVFSRGKIIKKKKVMILQAYFSLFSLLLSFSYNRERNVEY